MPKNDNKKEKRSSEPLQSPRGMHDILPIDQPVWQRIRKAAEDVLEYYNFLRIDTPMLESAALFTKTSGETSDIVSKEMYMVKGKNSSDLLALRPEGTASVARAYVQHGLAHLPHPLKLWYFGPFFRYERPQAGRLRQHHQIGLEIFSRENDPIYDAQVILAAFRLMEELKIKNLSAQINTVGCKICRPNYKKSLSAYYKSKKKKICSDCVKRLEVNPLRLLDCKKEQCQPIKEAAPTILDHLCKNCKDHFKGVLEYLENLSIPFSLNHYLVRGLDYYTKTAFEFFTEKPGEDKTFSLALGGGGRYDHLMESLGGKPTPGVGAGVGVERLIEAMKLHEALPTKKPKEKIFLIHIGDLAKKKSLSIIEELRKEKIPVIESLGKGSLAAQLKTADKLGSPYALIFGQKEAFEDSIIIRNMKTGAQETVPLPRIAAAIKRKI